MAVSSRTTLKNLMNRDLNKSGQRKKVANYTYSAYQYIRDLIDSVVIGDGSPMETVSYDDQQVGISNVNKGVTAPTDRLYNHGIGGGVTFNVLGFAVNDFIYFDVQTSHSMKLNTILDCHMHFILPNTTNVGDKFQFQLDVIAAGIGGTYAVPTGSPFTAEHTIVAGDNTDHGYLELGDIPASNTTVSTIYTCKLTRIAASANEYGSEVYLKYIDCHYQKDSLGSREEGAK